MCIRWNYFLQPFVWFKTIVIVDSHPKHQGPPIINQR